MATIDDTLAALVDVDAELLTALETSGKVRELVELGHWARSGGPAADLVVEASEATTSAGRVMQLIAEGEFTGEPPDPGGWDVQATEDQITATHGPWTCAPEDLSLGIKLSIPADRVVQRVEAEVLVDLHDYDVGPEGQKQDLFYAFSEPWGRGLLFTVKVDSAERLLVNTPEVSPTRFGWPGGGTVEASWAGVDEGVGNVRAASESVAKEVAAIPAVIGSPINFAIFNAKPEEKHSVGSRVTSAVFRVYLKTE